MAFALDDTLSAAKPARKSPPRRQAAAPAASLAPASEAPRRAPARAAAPRSKAAAPSRPAVAVSFPKPEVVRLTGPAFLADARSPLARAFLERVFAQEDVREAAISERKRQAEITFSSPLSPGDGRLEALGRLLTAGASAGTLIQAPKAEGPRHGGEIRYRRYGLKISTWIARSEIEGRVRLYHPALVRRRDLGRVIEREFMNTFGVERYKTNEITGTVLIHYDPRQIRLTQIVGILDGALAAAAEAPLSPIDLDLPINAVSVGLAVASRFAFPALRRSARRSSRSRSFRASRTPIRRCSRRSASGWTCWTPSSSWPALRPIKSSPERCSDSP